MNRADSLILSDFLDPEVSVLYLSNEKTSGRAGKGKSFAQFLLAYKISPAFLKAVESKGETFGRPAHRAKSLSLIKAQEGSKNIPVECFCVGNPRRGFPARANAQ